MNIIIGIGDYGISNKQEDILKTYALASCVGITMYYPKTTAAGMLHIALPDHKIGSQTISKPGYYATLGIPLLLQTMEKEFGCKRSDLVIQLFGGASSISCNDCFMIGKRNIATVTDLLSELGLRYSFAGVGGYQSRTIEMAVATGSVKVYTQPMRI
jgi:chemotaxis protein CheD